jgi:hypothetical protein
MPSKVFPNVEKFNGREASSSEVVSFALDSDNARTITLKAVNGKNGQTTESGMTGKSDYDVAGTVPPEDPMSKMSSAT